MSAEQVVTVMALLTVLTREMLWLCAIGIALSSLDDLGVDLLWLGGVRLQKPRPVPPAPAQPGHFAIIVPAWDEAAVIGPMLRRLLSSLQHPDFHVFVGCYPNDPDTQAAVRSITDARITMVINDRQGPTTKADCLNRLWQGVLQHEAQTDRRFKAVVLHDAEDLVHPQSLDVYDAHMPAYAMIQLPVLPLVDPQSRWVSGHYIDEFAEAHTKDMMVRSVLNAPIPSAGVGTAIDRQALQRIADAHGDPFDATSLTEDYEIGHRLHALGLCGRMVRARVDGELVATREFFPADFESAIRQKSRWLTGISLSGWDRLGWDGDWCARWMLLRDRKSLFTAALTMMAYGAGVLWLSQHILRAMLEADIGVKLPPLLGDDNALLRLMLMLNLALLGWRLLLRSAFVWRDYGWAEALRAIPRALVGNAINFLAALRAVDRYRTALRQGQTLNWDKTAHRFPVQEATNG